MPPAFQTYAWNTGSEACASKHDRGSAADTHPLRMPASTGQRNARVVLYAPLACFCSAYLQRTLVPPEGSNCNGTNPEGPESVGANHLTAVFVERNPNPAVLHKAKLAQPPKTHAICVANAAKSVTPLPKP